MISKISLGTAQFGMDYGITNSDGKPSLDKARGIIKKAKSLGIKNIDTASVYGSSETILGEIGVKDFNLTTKIPSIPSEERDIRGYINNVIKESLSKLKINNFHAVLLHDAKQLEDNKMAKDIHAALMKLKQSGLTKKIGISIYDPDKLSKIDSIKDYDVIQCPYNLFDRRLNSSGWMSKLKDFGIEIQIRSIFLQGLLLSDPTNLPVNFNKWKNLWNDLDLWLQDNNLSSLEACLNFAFKLNSVDSVVLGVDSEEHLDEIAKNLSIKDYIYPDMIFSNDLNLINPVNWKNIEKK
jgi:aryl-alcohol dehydrogenase-like predicted oxidoreductase